MSLVAIGPVFGIEHGDPSFDLSGGDGLVRSCTISGLATWSQVGQLSELVANADRRVNIAGRVGVLERIQFDDELLAWWTGAHLLESFSTSPSQPASLADFACPFSLKTAYLGDRQLIVAHSHRSLANDFGTAGQAILVHPFLHEAGGIGEMLVDAGGVTVAREYDPT